MRILSISKRLLNTTVKSLSSTLPAWTTSQFKTQENTARPYFYTPPANISELPAPFSGQYDREVFINSHKVYYLYNAYATWQGMVFKNLRIFIPSLFIPVLIEYFQESLLLKQWLGKIINFDDPGGVAIAHSQYAPHNYYHWVIDSLPRLLILKEFHPDVPLLLPEKSAPYITQSAAILGFTNFVKLNTREIIKAKKIILSDEHYTPLGHNDPELIRKVRTLLLNSLGAPDAKATKRIYLSRERQERRNVINQAELDILLSKYGFEKVFFEGLSLSEQIQSMQEAAVVLGVHGANMVNCLFSPENTPVIELQSISLHNPAYWRLCSALSMPYYCLPCAPATYEPVNNSSNVDIIVDLQKLESIFNRLGL